MERVETAVKEVFGPLNPREELTFEKLSTLFIEVRKKIEGETEEDRRCVFLSLFLNTVRLTLPTEHTNGYHISFHLEIKKPMSFKNLEYWAVGPSLPLDLLMLRQYSPHRRNLLFSHKCQPLAKILFAVSLTRLPISSSHLHPRTF